MSKSFVQVSYRGDWKLLLFRTWPEVSELTNQTSAVYRQAQCFGPVGLPSLDYSGRSNQTLLEEIMIVGGKQKKLKAFQAVTIKF